MEKKFIKTNIGEIAVFLKKNNSGKTPVFFLHGVYFDHFLWENQIAEITDRTVVAIDMPLHGESKKNIKADWNLDDCAVMLLDILDSLKFEKIIAVGHSWGSMTIVRAAGKMPAKFAALGLCNMPFRELTPKEKTAIKLQHTAMFFRKFYMKQAAKSLMGKDSLRLNPELMQRLYEPMTKLTNHEVKYTDKAVRIDAKDTTSLIQKITVPLLALAGAEDYAGIPPVENSMIVKGGHVSPLEVPDEVTKMIEKLFLITEKVS